MRWGPAVWVALASLALVTVFVVLRPRWAASLSALVALGAATLCAIAWATSAATSSVDLPWMTPLGSRLELSLDPLAAPIAVFLTGIAAPILFYAGAYLPPKLATHARPLSEQARFCVLMLAFMATMVLLVVAQDLLVLFVALELTALASFMLIAFDGTRKAYQAGYLALAITVGTSLVFLVGVLLIASEAGSTSVRAAASAELPPLALGCLVVGALGKSAQFPLHIWLPRAMVAPTPVSAYLHSAALVAAGVFVLMRLRVLLASSSIVLDALVVLGFLSIVIGGALALIEDELKGILAYSTVAQYGYVLVLVGLGGASGLAGAPLFILAHGVCKSALFLAAGAITESTGATRLSEVRGLARRMPLLAVSSAIAALGLAGFPLTIGYFKDEVLLAAASEHGTLLVVLAGAAIAMTFAYAARFWSGIFLGRAPKRWGRPPSRLLVWPVAFLSLVTLAGGVHAEPLRRIFEGAGSVVGGHAIAFELAYELGPASAVASFSWAVGLAVFLARTKWEPVLRWITERLSHFGPARLARLLARFAVFVSDELHRIEVHDLRDRIGAVLVPTAVLVLLALSTQGSFPSAGGFESVDVLPLVMALALVSLAALIAARPRRHFAIVIQISFVGFGLALAFAIIGAAEVALVIVLIETLFTLLFLGSLTHIRDEVLEHALDTQAQQKRRPIFVALLAGGATFVVTWIALATPPPSRAADAHLRLAESAHAGDVITGVLADFRGLDTAGELTVIAVAILGAVGIAKGAKSS